jgi:hypothetical protein
MRDVLQADISKLNSSVRFSVAEAAVASANSLPSAMFKDDKPASRVLTGPILVQLVDILDIGHSKFSILSKLRDESDNQVGNDTRNNQRRVLRLEDQPNQENGSQTQSLANDNASISKMIVQDSKGACAYGIELTRVPGLSSSMLGTKLILTGVTAHRGVLLLEPKTTKVLGGGVPEWNMNGTQRQIAKLKADLAQFENNNDHDDDDNNNA